MEKTFLGIIKPKSKVLITQARGTFLGCIWDGFQVDHTHSARTYLLLEEKQVIEKAKYLQSADKV